jgi:hypothetical protein
MSMQDRQQKACARGKQSCASSNYSLDASGMSLDFIENLPHDVVDSRRVNSSVRCLASQQATEVMREYLIRQLDDEEFSIPYAKWGDVLRPSSFPSKVVRESGIFYLEGEGESAEWVM